MARSSVTNESSLDHRQLGSAERPGRKALRKTFTAKLGSEAGDAVGDYVILGACNPNLASRALSAVSAQ